MTATAGGDTRAHARAHFDRFAGLYGRVPSLRRAQRAALAELAIGPEDDFLDVGCGLGLAVREAARTARRAVGSDISAATVERARAEAPDLDFHVADAAELPFADGEFSALLCTASAHHYPDLPAALTELARVLRRGGRAVVGDFCRDRLDIVAIDALERRFERGHHGFLKRTEIEGALRGAGFEPATWRTLWRGRYFVTRAWLASRPPARSPRG